MTSESTTGRRDGEPDQANLVGLGQLLRAIQAKELSAQAAKAQQQAAKAQQQAAKAQQQAAQAQLQPTQERSLDLPPIPERQPSRPSEWSGHSVPTQPLQAQTRPSRVADMASRSDSADRWGTAGGEGHPPRPEPRPDRPRPDRRRSRSRTMRRVVITAGAVLGLVGIAYAADLGLSSGEVPRGVVVAGIDLGGMDTAAADTLLHGELGPRAKSEVPVRIRDMEVPIVPSTAGLQVDWDGTWAGIGSQPLNPITRLTSLFTMRKVDVASIVDEQALDQQLAALRVHDRPTIEGTITFDNGRPVAVPPVPGRTLDAAAARTLLIENWAEPPIYLPVVPALVTVQPEAVERTLHEIAEPAVAAPVVFSGRGGVAELQPEQIASILSFEPDGQGGLAAKLDLAIATDLLAPQLASSEVEPKDATFSVSGGASSGRSAAPKLVPAVVGDKINWAKSLEQLPALLAAPQERTAHAVYEKVQPKLTTEAAQGLGITELMGEFTTNGFSGPSGVNIRVVAAKVNGAVVKPGETFSLNEFTGPRGTAEGYVESGIIDHGRPSTAVGGGISQFATTLYNAAYFAGQEDAGHTEHSYYISRYPAAREATVFDGAIDLKFRNNTPTGVLIQTLATDSDITVTFWGTKTVNVESMTGDRTKPTEPTTITLPKGRDCITSEGAPGFTISDTRVITDRQSGREVSRTTRTVKYDPVPIVKCE